MAQGYSLHPTHSRCLGHCRRRRGIAETLAANAKVHTRERYEGKKDDYGSRYDMAAAAIHQSCSDHTSVRTFSAIQHPTQRGRPLSSLDVGVLSSGSVVE
jgi:hypothetical protein